MNLPEISWWMAKRDRREGGEAPHQVNHAGAMKIFPRASTALNLPNASQGMDSHALAGRPILELYKHNVNLPSHSYPFSSPGSGGRTLRVQGLEIAGKTNPYN